MYVRNTLRRAPDLRRCRSVGLPGARLAPRAHGRQADSMIRMCNRAGCSAPARGDVDGRWTAWETYVPAHYCRQCQAHACDLARYLHGER